MDEDSLLGSVTTVRYKLDYETGRVTCPPSRYLRAALQAIRGSAESAKSSGLEPSAIGITSQAQTFVTLDRRGKPVGPAIVWTDSAASDEAAEAAAALPDFAATSGFTKPSPLQFLPKVMQMSAPLSHFDGGRRSVDAATPLSHSDGRGAGGEGAVPPGSTPNYLLLNEWLIYRLTGTPIGDACSHGMGGFWDISKGAWNERALALAGISERQLACIGPPGQRSALLSPEMQARLSLPEVPVYSCGNDNTAAAAGAGVDNPGDCFCSFGTAMVVYCLTTGKVAPTSENQIAGIGPSPGTQFLLAVAECGNILDWLAGLLYHGRVDLMLEEALDFRIDLLTCPALRMNDRGRFDLSDMDLSTNRARIARACLEYSADRFGDLIAEVSKALGKPKRLIAGGGLSRSRAWLELLERRLNLQFEKCSTEHPSLLGVARIIGSVQR